MKIGSKDEVKCACEILVFIAGMAITCYLGIYLRSSLIPCGIAFAITMNLPLLMNRGLPKKRPDGDDVDSPQAFGQYIKTSELASMRGRFVWMAICGDAALVYFIVDHFWIK